jgi:Uma2 family endonuclease
MSSAEISEHVSVDDYLAREEQSHLRHEYIDGWVRGMCGATVRHNVVKGNCLALLWVRLRHTRCRPFDADRKIKIRNESLSRFYYPNLQVVCESNAPTSVFQEQPVLLIEVLSPSTRRNDLEEKMAAYAAIPSLQCYIALEQHQPIAIVLRRTDQGFVQEKIEGIRGTIELPFLGCSLSMEEIYEEVEFTPECIQEPELEYNAQDSN